MGFYQTGGTATVDYLSIGGQSGSTNTNATFSLTGGIFSASSFQHLVAAASAAASITLGGSWQVTLPAFPVPAGAASLTFDFTTGWLSPSAASAAYMSGLTNAYLTANGAVFNVGSGKNITIGQVLQDAPAAKGTLALIGAGVLTLTGSNTYSGGTTVSGGTLQLGGNSALGAATGPLTVAAATLDLNGDSPTVGELTGNAALDHQTAFLAGASRSATAAGTPGTIQDGPGAPVSLTLNAPGETLLLSGTNTYTGGTTVDAGTLAITTASALADGSSLTVGAGGTFVFDPTVTGAPMAAGRVAGVVAASPAADGVAAVPEPGTMRIAGGRAANGIGRLAAEESDQEGVCLTIGS